MVTDVRPLTKKPKKRSLKKKVYICLEGGKKNQTERNYFNETLDKEHFVITYNKNEYTDCESLFRDAKRKFSNSKNNDFDMAFVVFDMDTKSGEWRKKIDYPKKNSTDKIMFIPSNPAFEYWLLLHYEDCKRRYNSNDELINHLKKYIKDYRKNMTDYKLDSQQIQEAIIRARRYMDPKNIKTNHDLLDTLSYETGTLVYRIFEIFSELEHSGN